MAIAETLEWIEALPLAQSISMSEWAFPAIEVVHVMAIAIVFGSISMVDLRLLGLARRGEGALDLMRELLPWTWAAFALAVVTGLLMFVSAATRYWENLPFRFKLLLLLLAGINMAVFHLTAYRTASLWNHKPSPPAGARIAGGVSVALWIGVVFLGRWIGFIDA